MKNPIKAEKVVNIYHSIASPFSCEYDTCVLDSVEVSPLVNQPRNLSRHGAV